MHTPTRPHAGSAPSARGSLPHYPVLARASLRSYPESQVRVPEAGRAGTSIRGCAHPWPRKQSAGLGRLPTYPQHPRRPSPRSSATPARPLAPPRVPASSPPQPPALPSCRPASLWNLVSISSLLSGRLNCSACPRVGGSLCSVRTLCPADPTSSHPEQLEGYKQVASLISSSQMLETQRPFRDESGFILRGLPPLPARALFLPHPVFHKTRI